jgi:hypothetical protein
VVMVAGVSGVRNRDEGYRPLVLFQRQLMNKLTQRHVYIELAFSDKRSWSPRKEILKYDCNFRNKI